jgi:hypothetical protein
MSPGGVGADVGARSVRSPSSMNPVHSASGSGTPLSWGNVLHCKLSNVRAAVSRASALGASAVVFASLPLWAVESVASGSVALAAAKSLGSTPSVSFAELLQQQLQSSTPAEADAPAFLPHATRDATPSLFSPLPMFVVSSRDGYELESRMVDLVGWGHHLTVGSSLDCRLPITNRWHRGVIYSVLSSPFHRWLRVAFPDLSLSMWRWAERPQSRAAWISGDSGGGPRSVPAGPVGDPTTKRLRWAPFDVLPPGSCAAVVAARARTVFTCSNSLCYVQAGCRRGCRKAPQHPAPTRRCCSVGVSVFSGRAAIGTIFACAVVVAPSSVS